MKRKLSLKRLAIVFGIIYLVVGLVWSACDSHSNPDRFKRCVTEGICTYE